MKNSQKGFVAVIILIIIVIVGGGVLLAKYYKVDHKDNILPQANLVSQKDKTIIAYDSSIDSLIEMEIATSTEGLIPVEETPRGTYILSQKASPDNKYIYYAIASPLEYGHPGMGGGYVPEFTVVFRYNKESKYSEPLFTGYDIPSKYPHSIDVSPEGKRVAFGLFGCNNCDGGIFTIIVYNPDSPNYLQSEKYKNIGEVLDFKFTGPTTYQYSEAVVYPCDSEAGPCYKAGAIHTGEF